MTGRLAAAMLLLFAPWSFAHRLDEYLQASLVEVEKGRIRADLTLTPGVAVSDFVVHGIDTDADGTISTSEGEGYAARVLADLTLTIDGRRLALQVISARFPAVSEMRKGTGEIQLKLAAPLPHGSRNRKIVLENRHESHIAAYQVNCRVPRDPAVRIATQKRNYTQSVYELDYEDTGEPQGMMSGLIWLSPLALLLSARLFLGASRRPISQSSRP